MNTEVSGKFAIFEGIDLTRKTKTLSGKRAYVSELSRVTETIGTKSKN